MHSKILLQARESIRTGAYVMSTHADDEADKDGFDVIDVERGVLVGTIVDRQRDDTTGEWKYVCHGRSMDDRFIGIVFKLSNTKKVAIITVYGEQK
jgi:uncharacterized DUF497 family protein